MQPKVIYSELNLLSYADFSIYRQKRVYLINFNVTEIISSIIYHALHFPSPSKIIYTQETREYQTDECVFLHVNE